MTPCLLPAQFQDLLAGKMDPAARDQMQQHLDECETCRAAFDEFRSDHESAVDAAPSAPDPTVQLERGPSGDSSPLARVAQRLPHIDGYRIVGVIGQGGMGTVYRAIQINLNRTVALKVLHAVVATANPAAVSRFRREATAAARLHHTHIIPIYDFGESHDGYYYTMELIRGQPLDVLIGRFAEKDAAHASPARLAELLQTHTAGLIELPPLDTSHEPTSHSVTESRGSGSSAGRGRVYFRQVARWIVDAADALDYAHQQGVIHRDIKPSNLILSSDGRIMIADFGLAKSAQEQSVTMTGSLVGTLRYMSPEQAMAKRVHVDHRTDVYSLGATMYELLCFRSAFEGADDKELLGAIISSEPPPLRKHNSHVPHELETICLKCLEKAPAVRYGTAGALADDLRRYLNDLPIVARRPNLLQRTVKFARRHRAPVIAAAAAVVLMFTSVFWAHASRRAKQHAEFARLAQIQSLHDSGMYFAQRRNWTDAETEFRRVLLLDPGHVDTLLSMVWVKLARYGAGQVGADALHEAEEFATRVLHENPNARQMALARYYRCVTLRRLGSYHDAVTVCEDAVRHFQTMPHKDDDLQLYEYDTWSNLGLAYAVGGDFHEALSWMRKGAEAADREADQEEDEVAALHWRNLAVLETHLGLPEALPHADHAIGYDRANPLNRIVRARALLTLEGPSDLSDAMLAVKVADELAGGRHPLAKRYLALAHLRNEQFAEAVRHARAAIELADMPAYNHLIMAVAEARMGRRDEAVRRLGIADATWPDDLREPKSVRVIAETGDLWIESADELLALRVEAEALIARPADRTPSP